MKLRAKSFEGGAVKLWVVVNYNCLGDSKSAHNILPDKLFDVFVLDACIGLNFYPLVEVIGGNE